MSKREEQILFALIPIKDDPTPSLMLGIPRGAWEYMHDGKTHTLDLTSIGANVKLVLFGAETHEDAMHVVEEAARANNIPLLDERRRDFSIREKK